VDEAEKEVKDTEEETEEFEQAEAEWEA